MVRLLARYAFCNARHVDRASANPIFYSFACAPERAGRGPPWGISWVPSRRPSATAFEPGPRRVDWIFLTVTAARLRPIKMQTLSSSRGNGWAAMGRGWPSQMMRLNDWFFPKRGHVSRHVA